MGGLVTEKDAGFEVEPGSWSPAAGCLALAGHVPLFHLLSFATEEDLGGLFLREFFYL